MKENKSLPRIAYSAKELSEMIGVNYQTVLCEIRAGKLVARRVGKEYRIHRDVIDEYLKWADQRSRLESKWTPKPEIGEFSNLTAPVGGSDYEARLVSRLRTKSSRTS